MSAAPKQEAPTFSRAFEQMCNFMAVGRAGNPRETIKGLLQLCLLDLPPSDVDTPKKIVIAIDTLFGVPVPLLDIEEALDELEEGQVISTTTGAPSLSADARRDLTKRVEDARNLEVRVKDKWLESLAITYPTLPQDMLWTTLRAYLSGVFLRHGLQAANILDPTIPVHGQYQEGLSAILHEVIKAHLPTQHHEEARKAISGFLARVGGDSDRARYIVQLADGTFNFHTLGIAPDLAKAIRSRLNSLTLFLDTNFLFGILRLHHNSQTEVSHELIRVVSAHRLPFHLRYHETTLREMRATIAHYAALLRARKWTKALSRAAARSGNFSGIEQKYHERNAEQAVDVEEFLRPFEHFDVLLQEKGIKIYRPSTDRLQERTDLHEDYKDFLQKRGRLPKTYETINHDATVLDATRALRATATSSLEAGALLVTCDYYLYGFDAEYCRTQHSLSSVLLPNILWQILRPIVPFDGDFDKAFVETFALPEFRAIGSEGSRACSRMLSILASYKDVPEETAFKLMSNAVLISKLRGIKDDKDFERQVEAAFVQENATLLEEKAALAREVERERTEGERKEREHAERINTVVAEKDKSELEKRELTNSLGKVSADLTEAKRIAADHQEQAGRADERARLAEEKRKQSEQGLSAEESKRRRVESQNLTLGLTAALSLGLLLVVGVLGLVHWLPWKWVVTHRNAIPIQVCFTLMVLFAMIGVFVAKWRKALWVGGVFAVLLVLIQALGA